LLHGRQVKCCRCCLRTYLVEQNTVCCTHQCRRRDYRQTDSDCHNGVPIFRRLSPLYRAVCRTVGDLHLAEQISRSAATTNLTHFAVRSPHLYAVSNDTALTSCALCSCPLRNGQLIFTTAASVIPSRSNQPI